MPNLANAMLAQLMMLTGEISVSVTDSVSTRTVTLLAAATTKYYRVYLAVRTDTGLTTATPIEILNAFENALNAAAPGFWQVRLQTSGAVKITYVGGSGTGTITWTANGATLRNILGFTGAATSALAVGGSQTATYSPTGCIVAIGADGASDTGWKIKSSSIAAATTATGITYTIDSGHQSVSRDCTLKVLPKTWSEQGSGEFFTPAFPPNTAAGSTSWKQPGATDYINAPPYSASQFISTAHRTAGACGIAIGELQQILAGSVADFDEGYIDAKTLHGEDELFELSVPGYDRLRDVRLMLRRTDRKTR